MFCQPPEFLKSSKIRSQNSQAVRLLVLSVSHSKLCSTAMFEAGDSQSPARFNIKIFRNLIRLTESGNIKSILPNECALSMTFCPHHLT